MSESRREMADAVRHYAEDDCDIEGGIVTGYVAIFEITVPGKDPQVVWITGNGAEPGEDNTEGLMSHRIDGLLEFVRRDLDWTHRTWRDGG